MSESPLSLNTALPSDSNEEQPLAYAALRRVRHAAERLPAESLSARHLEQNLDEQTPDEVPGTRLQQHGVHSLTDAELLSIIIGSGTRGASSVEIARELLRRNGDLQRLLSRDLSELTSVFGIANSKAIRLMATLECSRRLQKSPFATRKVIRSPADLASYYVPLLRGAVRETFRVLLLNTANQVYRENIVSEGTLNAATVHAREVFRIAITETAASIILLHNHPSGNLEPSKEDINITERLCEAGRIIDIKVLDHLIIAGESYMSFSERGML